MRYLVLGIATAAGAAVGSGVFSIGISDHPTFNINAFEETRLGLKEASERAEEFSCFSAPFLGSVEGERRWDVSPRGSLVLRGQLAKTFSSSVHVAEPGSPLRDTRTQDVGESIDSTPKKKARLDCGKLDGLDACKDGVVVKYTTEVEKERPHSLISEYIFSSYLSQFGVCPGASFVSGPSRVSDLPLEKRSSRYVSNYIERKFDECVRVGAEVRFMVQEPVGGSWKEFSAFMNELLSRQISAVLASLSPLIDDENIVETRGMLSSISESDTFVYEPVLEKLKAAEKGYKEKNLLFKIPFIRVAGQELRIARETSLWIIQAEIQIAMNALRLLKTIHSKGIVHGDIHAGNVAFRDPHSKFEDISARSSELVLIDFGLSRFFGDDDDETCEEDETELNLDVLNELLLSPWQLEGKLRAPRDDVIRTIETLAINLTPFIKRTIGNEKRRILAIRDPNEKRSVADELKERIRRFKMGERMFGASEFAARGCCTHLMVEEELLNEIQARLDGLRRSLQGLSMYSIPDYDLIDSQLEEIVQKVETF